MNPIDAPTRYRLFKKGAYGTFYIEDVLTRRQTSLKTNATRRMSKPQFICKRAVVTMVPNPV